MGRTQAAVSDRSSQDARDGTSCDLQVVESTPHGEEKVPMQQVSPVFLDTRYTEDLNEGVVSAGSAQDERKRD